MSKKVIYVNELSHYGVRGMKWGHRKQSVLVGRRRGSQEQMSEEQIRAQRRARAKKAAIIGGAVVAAGLAVYGGYKVHGKAVDSLVKKTAKRANDEAAWHNHLLDIASGYNKLKIDATTLSDKDIAKRMSNIYETKRNYTFDMADKSLNNYIDLVYKANHKNFTNKEIAKEVKNLAVGKIRHR